MAAIDKLYIGNYYEYDNFRTWAIIYYPKLLRDMYSPFITRDEWDRWQKENFILYKRRYGIEKDKSQVPDIYKYTWEEIFGDDVYDGNPALQIKLQKLHPIAVMNTPCSVDKKLLWICPCHVVQKYLEKNCGYKAKWYHKIFWRGRRHFS